MEDALSAKRLDIQEAMEGKEMQTAVTYWAVDSKSWSELLKVAIAVWESICYSFLGRGLDRKGRREKGSQGEMKSYLLFLFFPTPVLAERH